MDVSSACRHIPVEWSKAPTFSFTYGDNVMVDFRLPFGWRSSPGWWNLAASAVQFAHRNTSVTSAKILPEARKLVRHVKVQLQSSSTVNNIAPQGAVVHDIRGGRL